MSSKILLTFLKLFLRSGSSSVLHSGIKYCILCSLVCFLEAGCLMGSKATSMKLLIATVTDFRLGVLFLYISGFWHVTVVIHRFGVVELQYKGEGKEEMNGRTLSDCYRNSLVMWKLLRYSYNGLTVNTGYNWKRTIFYYYLKKPAVVTAWYRPC